MCKNMLETPQAEEDDRDEKLPNVISEQRKEVALIAMTQAGMVVLPIWGLALPLPAILLIAVGLYMILLAMVLWFRHCLKDHCCPDCGECCPNIAPFEYCIACGESCDCRFPSLRSCLDQMCPSPSSLQWPACDCACTCQPPECESCNCLCFEIKVR